MAPYSSSNVIQDSRIQKLIWKDIMYTFLQPKSNSDKVRVNAFSFKKKISGLPET